MHAFKRGHSCRMYTLSWCMHTQCGSRHYYVKISLLSLVTIRRRRYVSASKSKTISTRNWIWFHVRKRLLISSYDWRKSRTYRVDGPYWTLNWLKIPVHTQGRCPSGVCWYVGINLLFRTQSVMPAQDWGPRCANYPRNVTMVPPWWCRLNPPR